MMRRLGLMRILVILNRWFPRAISLPLMFWSSVLLIQYVHYGFKGEDGEHVSSEMWTALIAIPTLGAISWWEPRFGGVLGILGLLSWACMTGHLSWWTLILGLPSLLFVLSGVFQRSSWLRNPTESSNASS
jgi:hypothetical protein